jgi:hypothetical protein
MSNEVHSLMAEVPRHHPPDPGIEQKGKAAEDEESITNFTVGKADVIRIRSILKPHAGSDLLPACVTTW